MNSRQDRARAAQRHNARLDAPKVAPLFAWLAALCQWIDPRELGVEVAARRPGKATRRAIYLALAVAATAHIPAIPDRAEPNIKQRGRRR